MMKMKLTALVSALSLAAGLAHAQDNGALLDLLVKKKVISDQEAENVRAELAKEYATTSAGKLDVGSWVQEMKLSGDMRMRFQYENTDFQVPPTVTPAIAGTLPVFQGVKTPIFLPNSVNGSWYRDNQGNFHPLQKGQSLPSGLTDSTKYQRQDSASTFFFAGAGAPAGSYTYYRNNSGAFVQLPTSGVIPAGNKDKAKYAQISNQMKGNNGAQQNRWRFRLRIRDEFKLANNWFGGIELSTSSASDSGNQTFGAKDATGIGGGGFDKYGIFISRAYIGWNVTDWASVTVGKQANPFYSTDMVWDPDINPDGAVEVINFHKIFFDGLASQGGYSKDGKSVASVPSIQEDRPWELSLVMGQFIMSDNIENGLVLSEPGFSGGSAHHDYSNDAYLFDFQLQGSYKFEHDIKLTIAPAFMFYNAARISGANNQTAFTDINTVASNTVTGITYLNRQTQYLGETRDLKILTAPGDVTFKLGGLPVKFYWDFAYNFEGEKRDNNVYGLYYYNGAGKVTPYHSTQDDIAWLAGLQVGQNKKAGDWSVAGSFRQTGIAAVDPNLNDSDFALGKLNTQGFKFGAVYNFTDFCTGALTYQYAWNLRNIVGGQATSGSNIGNANNIQVLQVDLQVKF